MREERRSWVVKVAATTELIMEIGKTLRAYTSILSESMITCDLVKL